MISILTVSLLSFTDQEINKEISFSTESSTAIIVETHIIPYLNTEYKEVYNKIRSVYCLSVECTFIFNENIMIFYNLHGELKRILEKRWNHFFIVFHSLASCQWKQLTLEYGKSYKNSSFARSLFILENIHRNKNTFLRGFIIEKV